MTTPSALARRAFASPPARILLLGLVLLGMMGLSEDEMKSFAADPVKAAAHVTALAVAGLAIYLAHAHFIERRAASELGTSGLGRQLGIGLLVGAALYAACEAVLLCTSTGIVMLVMAHRRGLVVPPRWKRTG